MAIGVLSRGFVDRSFVRNTVRSCPVSVCAGMAETGASKDDIDDLYIFGWLQAARAKDQQKAYAGIAERSVRARCTMMI